MRIAVLGPQASPPARVERNQLSSIKGASEQLRSNLGCAERGQAGTPAVPGRRCSYFDSLWRLEFRLGKAGPIPSQL